MSLFRRDPDSHLEHELRQARPKPREELTRGIASRIERQIPARMGLRVRIGVAVASTVLLASFAASMGGVSYAASSASHAIKAVTKVVEQAHANVPKPSHEDAKGPSHSTSSGPTSHDNKDNGNSAPRGNDNNKGSRGDDNNGRGKGDDDKDNPGNHQYHKVFLCHEGHTISVGMDAVPAHLAHGDHLGKCTGKDRK
jgi:hypothetical protein